mgnify:CR=1 FL=1
MRAAPILILSATHQNEIALSKAISLNEGKEKIDGIENASKIAVKLNKICGPTAASKFAEIFIV